jgi:hypothetical protein
MNEYRRRVQSSQVLGSQLVRLARWLQRTGKQQQTLREVRLFRAKHARLTRAVRMSAQCDIGRDKFAQNFAAVSIRRGPSRTLRAKAARWAFLPEWKIAAKNGETCRT